MPPLLPFPRSIAPAPPPPAHGTHCAPRALDLRSAHTITDTTTTPPSSSPPSPGGDAPRPSVPDADSMSTALALLPDAALLATVCTLTARSNATLAALLAHLGEVEARGLHRHRACSSLYTYCLYELRLSEDAAFRRARAAGLVRRFPAAFGAIARGELHLTGLLQLGPHLTDDNAAELLARARYRTRREIARLVAELAPRPDAPAVLEPLGPEAAHGLRAPTHAEFTAALMGPVRSLAAGRAPADWLETALAQDELEASDAPPADASEAMGAHAERGDDAHSSAAGDIPTSATGAAGAEPGARGASPPPLRYRLQFTVSETYVELLREVQDLAAHALAPDDLAALHLRALEALAVTLRRHRHASRTPARHAVEAGGPASPGEDDGLVRRGADRARGPSGRCEAMKAAERPREATALDGDDGGGGGADPRQRGDAATSADGCGGWADPRQRGDAPTSDDGRGGWADPRQRGDDATDADSRADTADPRRHRNGTGNPRRPGAGTAETADPRRRDDGTPDPRQHGGAAVSGSPQRPRDPARGGFADPTSNSRYVPAADRRAVWLRDGGRCTLLDDRGVRCRETRWLEVHHLHAYARGGPTTRENLTLRCQAHNSLASEQDFGREHALRARTSARERGGTLDRG